MASTKCISANVIKNTGSATIAAAGNVSSSDTKVQDFSLAEINTINKSAYGGHITQAVSAASSGNLGTLKCVSGGVFAYQEKNKWVIPQVSTTIGGVASTLLANTANRIGQRTVNSIKVTHTAYLTAFTLTGGYDGVNHVSYTISAQAPDFLADDEVVTIGNLAYRTGKPAVVTSAYRSAYST